MEMTLLVSHFTSTPASIVNVTPDSINNGSVNTQGLFPSLHVVLEDMIPLTFVAKTVDTSMNVNVRPKLTRFIDFLSSIISKLKINFLFIGIY